jgi:hypothetical protein
MRRLELPRLDLLGKPGLNERLIKLVYEMRRAECGNALPGFMSVIDSRATFNLCPAAISAAIHSNAP